MSTYAALLGAVLPAFEVSLWSISPSQTQNQFNRKWRAARLKMVFEITMLDSALTRTVPSLYTEWMSEAICKLLEGLVADDFAPHSSIECKGVGAVCPRLHVVRERWLMRGGDRGRPTIASRENPFTSLIRPENLIQRLDIVTGQLELHNRMLAQVDDSVPFSDRAERPPSVAKSTRKTYACLYEAMQRDWHCVCATRHSVNLRLNANTPDKERGILEVDFFFYRDTIRLQWQEGRIRVKTGGETHDPDTRSKRIRFQADYDPEDHSDLAHISSICRHVSARDDTSSCLHMLLKDGAFCEIPSVSRTHSDLLPGEAISLDRLLQRRGKFTTAGKRVLAVILARSILPLLGTPWLSRLWTRQNIFFAYQLDKRLSEPFLSTSLKPEHTSDDLRAPVQCQLPGLSCLGILLWEIQLGQPIEDFWENDELEETHDPLTTSYRTAVQLLQSRREDLSPDYAEALDTCLNADFPSMLGEHEAEWQGPDETDWRAMYNRIVFPLEADLISGSRHVLPQDWSEEIKTLSDIWRGPEIRCWSSLVPPRSNGPSAGVITKAPVSSLVLPMPLRRVNPGYQLFDDQLVDVRKAEDTQKWLGRMRRVFEAHLDDVCDHPRVKIAVLDTGYDSSDAFIKGSDSRIVGSYCLHDGCRAAQDEDGHGTHILASLLEFAPFADLYVLRISHTKSPDGADDVARAIDWATEKWHVNLISMSFGFSRRTERLSNALANAASKNVIMFAAASNGGGNDGRAFPASDSKVICIHSTDGNGNRSGFSPTARKNDDNFALPGESIKSSWPYSATGTTMKSGTSFATPVAVALAANILEYAEQKFDAMPRYIRELIKTSDGIRKIFRLMVEDRGYRRDDYDYLTPWKLFGERNSEEYIYLTIQKDLE